MEIKWYHSCKALAQYLTQENVSMNKITSPQKSMYAWLGQFSLLKLQLELKLQRSQAIRCCSWRFEAWAPESCGTALVFFWFLKQPWRSQQGWNSWINFLCWHNRPGPVWFIKWCYTVSRSLIKLSQKNHSSWIVGFFSCVMLFGVCGDREWEQGGDWEKFIFSFQFCI